MTLNEKSWHAKWHKLIYTEDLPNNLCAYFWKLVFSPILAILYFPLGYLFKYNKIFKAVDEIPPLRAMLNVLIMGLVVLLFLALVWLPIQGEFSGLICVGLLVTVIGGTIGLCEWNERRKMRNWDRIKQPNILVEFIKAKKNKYCPKIDWKSNNQQEL